MRLAWIVTAFVMMFALAGCPDGGSSGPDITGMYQVSHHTYAYGQGAGVSVSCTTEGAAEAMPPYFQIVDDPDFGPSYEECTSADAASCGISTFSFFTGTDDGWKTVSSNTQMGGGTACTLYHEEHTATKQADGSLKIEIRDWDDFSPTECTLEAADKLGTTDTCRAHEVVIGMLAGG
jgi:hypothetical protein